MNYIHLSPYFPPNYIHFSRGLKEAGATVLGLGDSPYDELNPELKKWLTEYYRVDDLHNYDQLVRAVGYYTHKYGKIDGIDSQNEYWLETEAKLRTDFNISGLKVDQLEPIKKKSAMKKVFQKAGVNVARGKVLNSLGEGLDFAKEVGYPIVAKPDSGVGASGTFKIKSEAELEDFFKNPPDTDYIFEEYISGVLITFDGLVSRNGKLLFSNSIENERGVMEVVHEDTHIYLYSKREIETDLRQAGEKVMKAFGVNGRFFHFEFFREYETDRLVAVEVNMRPPGGLIVDMFNYACEFDIFRIWADVVVNNKESLDYERKYFVCFVSRKDKYNYALSHEEIIEKYNEHLAFHAPVEKVFSGAMGNYVYLVKSPDTQTMFEVQKAIHQLK